MNFVDMKNFEFLIKEFDKCIGSLKMIREFAFVLEYDTLEHSNMPDEYFYFYIQILSNDNYINIKGVENIIFALYNDFEKLDNNRKKIVFETIITNSNFYKNEEVLYYISDLLVRKYEKNKLNKIISQLENENIIKTIKEIIEMVYN